MKKRLLSMVLLAVGFATFAQVGVGTSTPDTSAALDVTSTTGGILVPRMDVTQRDAIATPANGLLIFNTSNNTFEVFKASCACWATITDSGNTPANSLVNTPPTASSLNYTGEFREGGTVNIVYTYADAQTDAEASTTTQWEVANDTQGNGKSNLGTAATQALTAAEAGRYVRAVVTPRAATGVRNGIAYNGAWTLVDAATVPYATAVSASGTVAQGSELTGVYTFNGGSGTEYQNPSDADDRSVYTWQSATNAQGQGRSTAAVPDTQNQHYAFFRPTSAHLGRYIRFGVRAKDDNALAATSFVYGPWVGPVEVAAEAAPVAEDVTYSPDPGVNVELTGAYNFTDANNDAEGATTFQWYTADDVAGTNQTAIGGATSTTFTATAAEGGKFVGFGVTPVAQTGTSPGTEVVYYNPTESLSAGTFSFDATAFHSNTYHSGRVMDATNTLTVQIDVSAAGAIFFSSDTVDGYSFAGGGTYPAGNDQQVVLTATGTKGTYNAAGDAFTITGEGTTTETQAVTIANVARGADFTAHYNGITAGVSTDHTLSTYSTGETFNNNGTAQAKVISVSACPGTAGTHGTTGTVTVGANTYNTVNINGQCWMAENLKELPGGNPVNATEWLASSSGDQGYDGYYNTATTNGSAGWGTTEPAAGEGLLYQWSAAMNGSATERAQGVCPTGWHIPSDAEWMYLEHGQGMAISEQTATGWRSSDADNQGTPSYKLRSAGTGATNASGFSGLLAGYRATNGTFSLRVSNGSWWSSSAASASTAYRRSVRSGYRGVYRDSISKANSFSVRCLKD